MNDVAFERLRALNPAVVDSAQAVAARAVAALPSDLQPSEEPAHVYRAASPCAHEAQEPA